MTKTYHVTKHYPHSLGLSAVFRQWRAAPSHCSHLHGYALAFTFEFEANTLDHRNWVIDFGGLKRLKAVLKANFDHKLIVAGDDPSSDELCQLAGLGVADVIVMERVGCESFAEFAFNLALAVLTMEGVADDVRLTKCTCHEHEGNSGSYSEQPNAG